MCERPPTPRTSTTAITPLPWLQRPGGCDHAELRDTATTRLRTRATRANPCSFDAPKKTVASNSYSTPKRSTTSSSNQKPKSKPKTTASKSKSKAKPKSSSGSKVTVGKGDTLYGIALKKRPAWPRSRPPTASRAISSAPTDSENSLIFFTE
ncbi:MAG: hypothetical protein IPK32_16855 [Verrucomicrobiaceae bacterium]|nr:hypothetical protein [Verrucomicrobiaceae bacterium]